ncbi:MAG: ribulose-phosphate 3-epimerase [Bacilli bacterium]|nr:ribulose-phosphate 3-epimerase [Bacilli bacterium]
MKVSVSILKEKSRLDYVIDKLQNTSADYIHIDIMDSTFTEENSFLLSELTNIKTNKKYDIHIMSTNLDYQINEAIKLNPEYITFHVESTKDVRKYIDLIKNNNIKVGLAINPKTRLWKIKKYLNMIDLVLVMSVEPGKGGQQFIPSIIKKIKKLKKKQNNFLINVDGGINDETVDKVKEYVDIVVSGSYITNNEDYESKIVSLKE